jgi:hypothetical protein
LRIDKAEEALVEFAGDHTELGKGMLYRYELYHISQYVSTDIVKEFEATPCWNQPVYSSTLEVLNVADMFLEDSVSVGQ